MMRRALISSGFLRSTSNVRFGSSKNKVIDVDDAVSLVQSGNTIAVCGFVTMGAPEELLSALGRRYEQTKDPKDLTVVFEGGPGDYATKGINHLAKEGLLKRAVGSHFGQTPMLGQMALDNKIEAYNFPMGAISRMIRCAATGQPAHITEIGSGTLIDPKNGGGKLNSFTKEDLVEEIFVKGKRYLAYPPMPIDVAFIRGTYADPDGNLVFTREALYGENLMMAMAARARRGIVIAQVEGIAARGSLNARDVVVPGTMVDLIVKAKPENHTMGYIHGWAPEVTGQLRTPPSQGKGMAMSVRKIIARRAALELLPNQVVNLGIGMPEGVAMVADEEQCLDYIELTTEPGVHGGAGLSGHNFGPGKNISALVTMDHQFDFYNGGGLDVAFLGNAETDQFGNVNVTRVGSKLTGPGGFVDITQSTKRVNLLGTFTAGGLEVQADNGKLKIVKEGKIKKFITGVKEITFSGDRAREKRQTVNYITERCVFELTQKGLELVEIAPGIDLEKDILGQMEFKPIIREPLRVMDASIFKGGMMNLKGRNFGGSLDLESRIAMAGPSTVFVDVHGLTLKTFAEVGAIEAFIADYVTRTFGEGKKAERVVIVYDDFDIHVDLGEEWLAVLQRLGASSFNAVSHHTCTAFLRNKLGMSFGLKREQLPESAAGDLPVERAAAYLAALFGASAESVAKAYGVVAANERRIVGRGDLVKIVSLL